jgi:hypothetical protein
LPGLLEELSCISREVFSRSMGSLPQNQGRKFKCAEIVASNCRAVPSLSENIYTFSTVWKLP